MNFNHYLSFLREKLPASSNWKFWLLIAFVAKAFLFLLLLGKEGAVPVPDGFWGHYGGDTDAYLAPMESFLTGKSYTPDFRLPGYGLLYALFFLLFSKGVALNFLIIVQLLLTALATYLIGLIALMVFKKPVYFYLTFLLYAISTYPQMYDTILMTESPGNSFLIITIFAFFKYLDTNKLSWALGTGVLMMESILLRPGFLPVMLLLLVIVIAYNYRNKINILKPVLLIILPFMVFDTIWVIRNYSVYNKFRPLQTTVAYPGTEPVILSQFEFVQSWGGDIVYWESKAEIRWFNYGPAMHVQFGKGVISDVKLPDYIYTSKFNKDSLVVIRDKLMATRFDSTLTTNQIAANKSYANDKFREYATSIKEEKPFLYYVKSRLILLKKFLVHSGTYNLFGKSSAELNKFELLLKVFYSLFYLAALFFGLLGILFLLKDSLMLKKAAVITGIVVYIATVHPFILRFAEYRYFIPAWSFLMICMVHSWVCLYEKFLSPFINKNKD